MEEVWNRKSNPVSHLKEHYVFRPNPDGTYTLIHSLNEQRRELELYLTDSEKYKNTEII